MKHKGVLSVAAVALAVCLVAAGCGGDGDDDEGGGSGVRTADQTVVDGVEIPPLTTYVGNADEICNTADRELEEAAGSIGPSLDRDPTVLEEYVSETYVPNVQGQIDDLREGIPPENEEEINAILDDAQVILDRVEAQPALLRSDPFAPIAKRFRNGFGITQCAN